MKPLQFMEEQADPLSSSGVRLQEHGARYVFAAPYCRQKIVLDAACGVGYGTDYLREQGAETIGIDADPACIETAKKRYPKGNYRHCRAEGMPPEWSGRFDVVVSFETIEHLQSPIKFISEVHRCLIPGGLFICSTLNKGLRVFRSANPHHVFEMSDADLQCIVSRYLPIIEIWGQQLHPRKHIPFIAARTLLERLARRLRLPPMGISTKLSEPSRVPSPFEGCALVSDQVLPSFLPTSQIGNMVPEVAIVVATKN